MPVWQPWDAGPADHALAVAARDHAGAARAGAGPGIGTEHLLSALPESSVCAIEPDDAARAALAWRLASHPGRERLCLLPLLLGQARALAPFDLVVMRHVICTVAQPDRPAFWADLRACLADGGVVVMDTHLGATSPDPAELQLVKDIPNGECTVQWWWGKEPVDELTVRVTNEYRYLDAEGREVHRVADAADRPVVDEDVARQQILDAGFVVQGIDEDWVRLTVR